MTYLIHEISVDRLKIKKKRGGGVCVCIVCVVCVCVCVCCVYVFRLCVVCVRFVSVCCVCVCCGCGCALSVCFVCVLCVQKPEERLLTIRWFQHPSSFESPLFGPYRLHIYTSAYVSIRQHTSDSLVSASFFIRIACVSSISPIYMSINHTYIHTYTYVYTYKP